MLAVKYKVTNEFGLHAKASTELVRIANQFHSDIKISADKIQANAKSIMGVMSLGITYNEVFEMTFNGDDEKEALDAISLAIIDLKIGKEI